MTFEDLVKFKNEMDNAFGRIPNFGINEDIACAETNTYYSAVSNFLTAGKIFFNKQDISMDELLSLYNEEFNKILHNQDASHIKR